MDKPVSHLHQSAAFVYRGAVVEAEHAAIVAVVDASGRLTHKFGDPHKVIMTRSSVKPFQVVPLIQSGGLDAFGFDERQLAVMCASHNGEDIHREVVESNLKRIGCDAADLQCGTHWPMAMQADLEYPQRGEDKDPLRHNCSGKHSGFLALAKHLNEPLDTYLDPKSAVQQYIMESVSQRCEYAQEKIEVGIDGCSAPVFSMPLVNLAIGFKNLALGRDDDAGGGKALDRVREAMIRHPYLGSGKGRFDYDLMRSLPGRVVAKVGAEAVQGMGFTDPPLGVCVKVLDGAWRALGPICVHVLQELGIVDNLDRLPHLQPYVKPDVRNARGTETGRIVVDFRLQNM